MSHTGAPVDVGRMLDEGRWGGYQIFVVALAALAIIFDGVDIQTLGVAIPSLMQDWQIDRAPFKWVSALGLVGMASGSILFGLLGDRFGRRRALVTCLAVLGIFTAASAYAGDITSLTILRFLAGLGLGGALPNASALSSEYVPRRLRPIAVTLTIVCVPLGASLAGFVAKSVLETHTWHTIFLLGGVSALVVAAILVLAVPESPRFLARSQSRWPELERLMARLGRPVAPGASFVDSREQEVTRTSVSALLTPQYRRDSLLLWSAFFTCLFAVYLAFTWLPATISKTDLGAGAASLGLAVYNLGGVAGAILAALVIQKFGSRGTMAVTALIAIAGALVLSGLSFTAEHHDQIMIMLGVTGGAINAVQTTLYALSANMYPTAVRATGVGAAATIGRVGAMTSSFLGVIGGSSTFFVFTAIAMGCTTLALVFIERHVPRRAPMAT
ncbi:MAG TPA: MFS transporter [Steroidobacteraceae bacterium]|nr:MFS transporter [Steroidobacteraceae bacterium]